MHSYEIKIINKEEDILQIIAELKDEYGVQRKGDTYMSEDRLRTKFNEFVGRELEVAGVFERNNLCGFASYKITNDGLYVDNILVFKNHRGKSLGVKIVKYLEEYATQHKCKQVYFGARRSANEFYYKLGYEGSCLIQSDKATKLDLEQLMKKYGITEYSYNLYEGCNPPVNQIRANAKCINNSKFLNELDNSNLNIGCILTFSKKI